MQRLLEIGILLPLAVQEVQCMVVFGDFVGSDDEFVHAR